MIALFFAGIVLFVLKILVFPAGIRVFQPFWRGFAAFVRIFMAAAHIYIQQEKSSYIMLKYMQESVDDLVALKTGISENPTLWANMPVTIAHLDAAITAITNKNTELEAAEAALQQRRVEARRLVEQYNPLIDQATNLATGLHTTNPEKLSSYGISQPKAATTVPPPGKAVVASVKTDTDGEGFIITLQALQNADTYEIEKAVAATADATVPPDAFVFYKSTKKLTLVDDDVLKGKRYYYRARAMNRNGLGEVSEPVSAIQ